MIINENLAGYMKSMHSIFFDQNSILSKTWKKKITANIIIVFFNTWLTSHPQALTLPRGINSLINNKDSIQDLPIPHEPISRVKDFLTNDLV